MLRSPRFGGRSSRDLGGRTTPRNQPSGDDLDALDVRITDHLGHGGSRAESFLRRLVAGIAAVGSATIFGEPIDRRTVVSPAEEIANGELTLTPVPGIGATFDPSVLGDRITTSEWQLHTQEMS